MPQPTVPGRSAVSRRAITDIIRSAVLGSYGITGFATRRPIDRLLRLLGAGEPGIRLRWDDVLGVDLHVRMARGLPVAEVARQVESAVRYAASRALDRELGVVTIHVEGLSRPFGGPRLDGSTPAGGAS